MPAPNRSSTSFGRIPPLTAAVMAGGAVLAAAALGRLWSPDRTHPRLRRRYDRLEKPPFTPPKPVFALVWPTLDVLLAVAGHRLMTAAPSPERTASLALWTASVAGVGAWTGVFAGGRRPAAAAFLSVGMLGVGAALTERAARVDPVAAALVAPYVGWVAFASALSEEVARRNRGQGDWGGGPH